MTGDFIQQVKELGLPEDGYVVVGSVLLDVLGIRQAKDIDILVSKDLLEQLSKHKDKWRLINDDRGVHLVSKTGLVELWDSWHSYDGEATIYDLIDQAELIDGVRFSSLEFVEKYKQWMGRPKDKKDLELIADYRRRVDVSA